MEYRTALQEVEFLNLANDIRRVIADGLGIQGKLAGEIGRTAIRILKTKGARGARSTIQRNAGIGTRKLHKHMGGVGVQRPVDDVRSRAANRALGVSRPSLGNSLRRGVYNLRVSHVSRRIERR